MRAKLLTIPGSMLLRLRKNKACCAHAVAAHYSYRPQEAVPCAWPSRTRYLRVDGLGFLAYTIYHLHQERCRLSATCFKEITSAHGYPLSR